MMFENYDTVIHKIAINIEQFDNENSRAEVSLPRGAYILAVDNQRELPTFWYTRAAIKDIPLVKRNIYMFATGQTIPKELERLHYIDTVLFFNGEFVYHFYTGYEEGTVFAV